MATLRCTVVRIKESQSSCYTRSNSIGIFFTGTFYYLFKIHRIHRGYTMLNLTKRCPDHISLQNRFCLKRLFLGPLRYFDNISWLNSNSHDCNVKMKEGEFTLSIMVVWFNSCWLLLFCITVIKDIFFIQNIIFSVMTCTSFHEIFRKKGKVIYL